MNLLVIPPDVRNRLATALETGMLPCPCTSTTLRAVIGVTGDTAEVQSALERFSRLGVPGPAAAAWIRSVDAASRHTPRPDLVWSGPEVPGVAARDTRRVYDELLGAAEHTAWISSFAFFDGQKVFEKLAARMDSMPQLQVTLLLNIQRRRGDTSSSSSLIRGFADHFWGSAWPGTARPRVFFDPRSLELDGPDGVLHAKAVVTDEEAVFVTSANLTEAALDRNIEVGLLARDRALALSVTSHFRGLIERGVLSRLPNS